MRKLLTSPLLLLFACAILSAQQTSLFSQYVLNEFVINPAVTGNDGMTSINLSGRKQWAGWENAPETYSASFATRILKKQGGVSRGKYRRGSGGRVGLGGSLKSDRNGAINRTSIQLTYAYHLQFTRSQLSFGLAFLTTQFKIDDEFANLKDPDDPRIDILGKSSYIPDAAAGINLATEDFHLGLSVYQLLQSPIKFGEVNVSGDALRHYRQYNLIWIYHKQLERYKKWEVEPSVYARATEKLQFSADFSLRMIYKNEYWGGISLRTSKDFVLMFGFKVQRMYFGYAFDYGFNEISRLSYGSHEATIAFKFGDSTRRYRWWERY